MPERSAPEAAIHVVARADGRARLFELSCGSRTKTYRLADPDQERYLDFLSDAARDFGLRNPSGRAAFDAPPADPALRALLTRPVSPDILYGYGDPCVVRVLDPANGRPAWWLTCTSNDAPNAFPILKSSDLTDWRLESFVFPRGQTPPWALTGEGQADFWAPELHPMGEGWWLLFAARLPDRDLAIGLAKGSSPAGPFTPEPEPLLAGGVIDPHLFVFGDQRLLYWKEDANGVWPQRLASLLARDPALAAALFAVGPDRNTAAFAAAVWPWAQQAEPMEQFFILQPLIEAVTSDYAGFALRLADRARAQPEQAADLDTVMAALKTRIFAQPLSVDGRKLEGEPRVVLENDQAWEAHLIEGVWITEHAGRFYLFYAGNDFSTSHYAIGAAMADHPLGPWRKTRPLLRSSRDWIGPGHPSVAPGPDGEPWLFLHAFLPEHVGYKAFRAVLGAPLQFGPDGPSLALEEPALN